VRDDSLLVPALAIFAVIIGLGAWPFIAIFLHELGHATAAKLVGLAPTHLIVGLPDESDPLFSFRVFDCLIEWWPLPLGGATIFASPPTDRFKAFIITIGGPLVDVCVIFICWLLWQHTFLRVGLFCIILSQSIDILRNLIPFTAVYDGVRVPSDGKLLLQLLARKHQT
jgi:Peptidase family M50